MSRVGARRLVAAMRRLSEGAVVLVFGFMVLSVAGEVFGRAIGYPMSNVVETAVFAQIALTTLGASVALRQGAMFALDTVTRHLGLTGARVASIAIAVLSAILIVVLIYGGVILTKAGINQSSPVLLLPMWPIYMTLPVGMTLLLLEIVISAVERWDKPFVQPSEELT